MFIRSLSITHTYTHALIHMHTHSHSPSLFLSLFDGCQLNDKHILNLVVAMTHAFGFGLTLGPNERSNSRNKNIIAQDSVTQ